MKMVDQKKVDEAAIMMRGVISRPKFRAWLRKKVRAAILDALRQKMAEIVDMADKLEDD